MSKLKFQFEYFLIILFYITHKIIKEFIKR